MDKSQAVLNFLNTCPIIQANPMFFNFGNVENNAHHAVTNADDISLQKPYIDGSVLKRYTFHIDCYKSVSHNPIVSGYSDENLDDFKDVQNVLEWIEVQDELRNYPSFDATCIIEKMQPLTTKPSLIGVDTNVNPPLALYRISIQIDYLDTSKRLWN